MLSALETYRTAIRRIGQGTGPTPRGIGVTPRSHDGRPGAVPCWIMSHAKVSESMPAELGAFDLGHRRRGQPVQSLGAAGGAARHEDPGGRRRQAGVTDGGFISAAEIQALRERFLSDQPYRAVLTPEKSLYDIASTVFAAQQVMLAEHFRCVQPIIAYSNRTFYKDQIRPLARPEGVRAHRSAAGRRLVTDGLR